MREIRRSRGYTQEVLAERADIPLSYLKRLEQKGVNLTIRSILKLCRALETSPYELFKQHGSLAPRPRRPRSVGRWSKRYQGSDYRGVYCRLGKWYASIQAGGVRHAIGPYKNEVAAARAYDRAARRLHGDKAKLNFPRRTRPGGAADGQDQG